MNLHTPSVLLEISPCNLSGPLKTSNNALEKPDLRFKIITKLRNAIVASFAVIGHRRHCQARGDSRRGDRSLIIPPKNYEVKLFHTFLLVLKKNRKCIEHLRVKSKRRHWRIYPVLRLGRFCAWWFAFSLELGNSWGVGYRVFTGLEVSNIFQVHSEDVPKSARHILSESIISSC